MYQTENEKSGGAYPMDNKKFGEFIAQLRKEKHLTQKELAEKLFISDKAVSKWERGLSIPNVSMLIPIAEALEVTVTELLRGERLEDERILKKEEIEELVTCSMEMSFKEQEVRQRNRRWWVRLYLASLCIAAAELFIFGRLGFSLNDMAEGVLPYAGMLLIFGGWFCIFARETLPAYYDENKINFISDGFLRMNMPGLYFNNSNWPHILNTARVWCLAGAVGLPVAGYILWVIFDRELWVVTRLLVPLAFVLGMFIPMYVFGKKYE